MEPVPRVEFYNRQPTLGIFFYLRNSKFRPTNAIVFCHSYESRLFDIHIFFGHRFIAGYSGFGIGNRMTVGRTVFDAVVDTEYDALVPVKRTL